MIPAILYFVATFFWERIVFQFPLGGNGLTYVICKFLQLAILLAVMFLIKKIRKADAEKKRNLLIAAKYALPYTILLAVVTVYQYHNGTLPYLSGDEERILSWALGYDSASYMFTYITGYYYIICISLIPTIYAPVIIKVLIQAAVLGYIMMRLHNIWRSKLIFLWYLLFLAQPVLFELGPSAHRLPLYGMLYIWFIVKLWCDHEEQRQIPQGQMFVLMAGAAILLHWRVEGIYLIVFAPLLLIAAYNIKERKKIIAIAGLFWALALVVAIPQWIENSKQNNYVNERMSHFYNYVFVNMCRNGLDQEEYREELQIIDRYLSIDAVNRINDELGDLNYSDELIAFYEGYVGVREDYSDEEYEAYTGEVLKLIIKEPLLYLQSQLEAWNYISWFEDEAFATRQTGVLKLVKYALVLERFLVWQLYIPTLTIILCVIYSLIKKRWLELVTTVGVFGHHCIVFLLMPASYFKYFYIVYLVGYFILLWHILERWAKKRER